MSSILKSGQRLLAIGGAAVALTLCSGCGHRVAVGYGYAGYPAYGYSVYSPYYGYSYAWGPGEQGYYDHWRHNYHVRERDFRRLPAQRQQAYFQWRRDQGHPPARRG